MGGGGGEAGLSCGFGGVQKTLSNLTATASLQPHIYGPSISYGLPPARCGFNLVMKSGWSKQKSTTEGGLVSRKVQLKQD